MQFNECSWSYGAVASLTSAFRLLWRQEKSLEGGYDRAWAARIAATAVQMGKMEMQNGDWIRNSESGGWVTRRAV